MTESSHAVALRALGFEPAKNLGQSGEKEVERVKEGLVKDFDLGAYYEKRSVPSKPFFVRWLGVVHATDETGQVWQGPKEADLIPLGFFDKTEEMGSLLEKIRSKIPEKKKKH